MNYLKHLCKSIWFQAAVCAVITDVPYVIKDHQPILNWPLLVLFVAWVLTLFASRKLMGR